MNTSFLFDRIKSCAIKAIDWDDFAIQISANCLFLHFLLVCPLFIPIAIPNFSCFSCSQFHLSFLWLLYHIDSWFVKKIFSGFTPPSPLIFTPTGFGSHLLHAQRSDRARELSFAVRSYLVTLRLPTFRRLPLLNSVIIIAHLEPFVKGFFKLFLRKLRPSRFPVIPEAMFEMVLII